MSSRQELTVISTLLDQLCMYCFIVVSFSHLKNLVLNQYMWVCNSVSAIVNSLCHFTYIQSWKGIVSSDIWKGIYKRPGLRTQIAPKQLQKMMVQGITSIKFKAIPLKIAMTEMFLHCYNRSAGLWLILSLWFTSCIQINIKLLRTKSMFSRSLPFQLSTGFNTIGLIQCHTKKPVKCTSALYEMWLWCK